MTPPNNLPTRKLGRDGPVVPSIGLGLMSLSAAYGAVGSDEERFKLLDRAWEIGCTNWDTSDQYGDSEDLLGKWFKLHPERRADIFLASKFGLKVRRKPDDSGYDIGVDNSPEYARVAIERSLKRLGVDYLDLYYVHRLDSSVPVEKTIEVLAEFKRDGRIKAIGLSGCTSRSLRRAYKVTPIDAVQMEYSPWVLDIENDVGTNMLSACQELGVTVFAYSPLGRGFLTGKYRTTSDFGSVDSRNLLPRFQEENMSHNLPLVDRFHAVAGRKGCTPGQVALAWLLAQSENIIPIPGTKKISNLEENVAALNIDLSTAEVRELRDAINACNIVGERGLPGPLLEYGDTPEL